MSLYNKEKIHPEFASKRDTSNGTIKNNKRDREILMEMQASFTEEDFANLASWLDAYKKIKKKPYHLLGHFLNITWLYSNMARMDLGMNNINRYGNAQGGALYTLADIVIAEDIFSRLQDERNVLTLEMKMNYVKKAAGSYVIGQSHILHIGGKTAVAECSIYDEQADLVAKAFGTFYLQ